MRPKRKPAGLAPGKERRAPTFIDIFAGCGGLSLGLMQAGWEGLFAVEKDPNAFSTLQANLISRDKPFNYSWPKWLPAKAQSVSGVLRKYHRELEALSGRVDMLVGGPPCQGFSTAGRRDPSDPRNQLVRAYLKFVKILKPRLVLIENVRGFTADFEDGTARAGKRNYAAWIIRALEKDYVVSSKMLDLSQFGVPQKRHRFFVIAVRKKQTTVEITNPFDKIEQVRNSFLRRKGIAAVPVSVKAAISDFEIKSNTLIPSRDSPGFKDISYKAPTTSYQRIMNGKHRGNPSDTRLAKHSPEIVRRFKKIIDLCKADGRLAISLSPEVRASFGLKKCAIRVLDPDRPSPTITSMPDDLIHYGEPRALTVRENARLQGFPDWFEFKGKYTTGGERRRREVPRFTQVANAVPPLAAEAIGIALTKL